MRTWSPDPPFADEAQELRDFIGERVLVGHNVQFDKRFLNAEFKRAGVKTLRRKAHCTMWRFYRADSGRERLAMALPPSAPYWRRWPAEAGQVKEDVEGTGRPGWALLAVAGAILLAALAA